VKPVFHQNVWVEFFSINFSIVLFVLVPLIFIADGVFVLFSNVADYQNQFVKLARRKKMDVGSTGGFFR
jgi:hypothetical protein